MKPFAKKLGIHSILRKPYWKAKIALIQTVEQKVSGIEVEFEVNNLTELTRFRELGGEREILIDLLSEVDQDDVVFDVGANVGTYTCFLAKALSAENVIAFEPHPTNLVGLRSNLDRNETDATVIEKGLSDTDGAAELAIASRDEGEGRHSLATGEDSETIEIELTTGDGLVDEKIVPSPTIIKVDVEGAEGRVLRGLQKSLSRDTCRLCYVEVHPNRLPEYSDSPASIKNLLEECGFTLTELQRRGGEYFLKGKK